MESGLLSSSIISPSAAAHPRGRSIETSKSIPNARLLLQNRCMKLVVLSRVPARFSGGPTCSGHDRVMHKPCACSCGRIFCNINQYKRDGSIWGVFLLLHKACSERERGEAVLVVLCSYLIAVSDCRKQLT